MRDESINSRPKIIFVCSSALHVQLFMPAIKLLLLSDNFSPVIVSLDTFYSGIHGNVVSYVNKHNLAVPVEEIYVSRGKSSNRLIQALASIHSARTIGVQSFRDLYDQNNISLVIFGNDTGHLERAALCEAQRLKIISLLVQDGFLFDQYSEGISNQFKLLAMHLWLAIGGDYYGNVPYGMGGCDFISVHGEVWAKILRVRKRRKTKQIIITGHPALSRSASLPDEPRRCNVTFFCTNFLSGHNDKKSHLDQINEIKELRILLTRQFSMNITLRVKLHPADSKGDYKELSIVSGIKLCDDNDHSMLICSSWICVTNISSVAIDCLSSNRLCFMSGINMMKGGYRQLFAALPGRKYSTWDEFKSYLKELDKPDGYSIMLKQNKDAMLPYIDTQSDLSGAERMVSLIYQLASTEDF